MSETYRELAHVKMGLDAFRFRSSCTWVQNRLHTGTNFRYTKWYMQKLHNAVRYHLRPAKAIQRENCDPLTAVRSD
jgi:hypothetical protein